MKIDFDVDIDLADRDAFLKNIDHVPASIIKNHEISKHNTGVYFQKMPCDPITGLAALDYKEAQELGFFKVDFLNNHVYADVRDSQHLEELVNREPLWELLEHSEIVERLFHINNYADLLAQYKPCGVKQLAMILAMIRPAKRYLIGKSWQEIEQEIWNQPAHGEYHFKKSHAVSYALVIVVQMNLLVEQLET